LLESLYLSWSAVTSLTPDEWSATNPAAGQCAVTALVVNDLFGGDIVRGAGLQGSHYWNRLAGGIDVDLTESQFLVRPAFVTIEVRSRAYVLSFPDTLARYELLLDRLRAHAARPRREP